MASVPYTKGVHEVAEGVWAYLQPDGGWGLANAGLVADPAGDHGSLLIDTLFDLEMTAEMLEALHRATPSARRITTVVNTHGNGDHCYGNALLPDAEIIASEAACAEMHEVPPAVLAGLLQAAPEMGRLGAYVLDIFGRYHFDGIEPAPPTRTFTGELELAVGGRTVRLLEVGPAHTAGDVVVHVPDAGVLFTGDILFHGGHPVVWAGPVASWMAACDRLLALDDVETVVPGHGPVTDLSALTELKGYFERLVAECRACLEAGKTPLEAARTIDLGRYDREGERERLVANVSAVYRDLGAPEAGDPVSVLELMAEFREAASP